MKPAVPSLYPASAHEWDRWILDRRPLRADLDPWRPYDFRLEHECSASGETVPVATIFLTNRECPWRCLMCDLWRNTLEKEVPAGAIPAQIDHALARLAPARQIKLYNSGSFFDPHAVPPGDHSVIAGKLSAFERLIVESHPALIGDRCLPFRDSLGGRLEVAMGLETAHSEILLRLNKRMTLPQFSAAAEWLRKHEIDLRVFVLVQPPFMKEAESLDWAERSLDFAFNCGATAVSLIPTRSGNGAMEQLAASGDFSPPRLKTLEAAAAYGLSLRRGRVFTDLWDLKQVRSCWECRERRVSRLREMNLNQTIPPRISCLVCGE